MAMASSTAIDAASLQRLLSWLSPAYPVGAYTYSHGLERAVEDGAVRDRAGLVAYVSAVLEAGAGRIDGALLAAAFRAAEAGDDAALDEVTDLANAWRGTAETALETMAQGTAFLRVTTAAWPEARLEAFARRHRNAIAHPVALGAAAAWQGMPLRVVLFSFLSAFSANIVSAGVRFGIALIVHDTCPLASLLFVQIVSRRFEDLHHVPQIRILVRPGTVRLS